MRRFQSLLLVTGLFLSSQVALAESSFAAKINSSPSPLTALAAGGNRTFTFTLDEPIFCETMDSTCFVRLAFTNSGSAISSLSSSTIEWAYTDWTQTRTMTLTVNSTLSHTDSSNIRLSAVTQSNSEYYRSFAVTINQPVTLPPSPEQIVANNAAAAVAAAAEAARLRQIEIANFRSILFAKFVKGERPKLVDYTNALFNQVTSRTFETVTDRVLLLDVGKRSDLVTIIGIANDVVFYDDFFNQLFRPTVSTYIKYGYTGVTERTLVAVNAQVLVLPLVKRADLTSIQAIATAEALTDRIANPATRSSVTATFLISNGLLAADSGYRYSVVSGLASYPEASLNTRAKIEAAIKAELVKAGARKAKTAEIRARIAARNK